MSDNNINKLLLSPEQDLKIGYEIECYEDVTTIITFEINDKKERTKERFFNILSGDDTRVFKAAINLRNKFLKKDKKENSFLSFKAIIIGLFIAIPTWFYGTFVFHTLYEWFLKDAVKIDLTYMQCMGILVVIKFLKHPSSLTELDIRAIFEKHLTPAQSYFKMIIGYYGPVTLTFLIGCVIKIFV